MMNLLLPFVLLLAPIQAETGQFNIVQEGRKIGTEQYTITKVQDGYRVEGRTTIGDVNISSRMDLNEKLLPTFYEYSNEQGTIRVRVNDPLSEFESRSTAAAESESIDFRFPERGVILDNNFFHHFLILLYRQQAGENMFSVFVPQDMRVGSATVRPSGPRNFDLEVGDVKLQATTDGDGRLMRLSVPDAKVVVER
jgi:hypothetical protein